MKNKIKKIENIYIYILVRKKPTKLSWPMSAKLDT